jgi:hypothetical protein
VCSFFAWLEQHGIGGLAASERRIAPRLVRDTAD